MKRLGLFVCMCAIVAMAAVPAAAQNQTTITFDASQIVQLATGDDTDPGAPLVGDGNISFTSGPDVRTYVDPFLDTPNVAQSSVFNDYLNQVAATPGGGVSDFNLWLQGDIAGVSQQSTYWNENIQETDWNPADVTITAPAGWTAEEDVIDPSWGWGPVWDGRIIVEFVSNDPSYNLMPGMAPLDFSVTMQTNAPVGTSTQQIWVGTDVMTGPSDFVDNGTDYGSAWMMQRAISADVVATPEPSGLLFGLLAAGSVVSMLRRK